MKQVMKRKIRRVERTNQVQSEISHKPDIGLARRVDSVLAGIECAMSDADQCCLRRNGCG